MKKTYSLIIWEENPENTRLFLVPNSEIDEEMLDSLKQANGAYINSRGWDKNKGLLAIDKFLFDEDGECIRKDLEIKIEQGKLPLDNGKFSDEDSGIVRVCHTGIIL